jgi:hypothetical protein
MKLRTTFLATILLAAVLASGNGAQALADTTVTVAATKDAMILGTSANVDTNNASGKGPGLFSGADNQTGRKRSIIAFDVASAGIPASATIVSVTMTLHLAQVAGGSGSTYPSRTLRVHRLRRTWGEGTSGSPTATSLSGAGQGYPRLSGDSSWSYAVFSGSPWPAGGDFNATASASSTLAFPFTLNGAYTWSSTGLVSDVSSWVKGTAVNYGWELKSDLETSPGSFLAFWSRDGAAANANPAIAPRLTIVYR